MSDVKTLNSIQMKHFQQLYVKANFKKITGGGVKCLLFHTVPPPTKNRLKICLSPFHEALDNFSFVKFPVPGHTPGTRSWNTSRNALLGDFQECTPGQAFGANHGTLLKCQVKTLNSIQIKHFQQFYAGVNILRKPRKLFPKATNRLFPKSDA